MHPATHGTVVVTKTLQQTNLRDCFPAPSHPSPPPLPPRRVAWWVETMGDTGREGGEGGGVDRLGDTEWYLDGRYDTGDAGMDLHLLLFSGGGGVAQRRGTA